MQEKRIGVGKKGLVWRREVWISPFVLGGFGRKLGEKKSRKGWHLGNRKGEGLSVERRIKVWGLCFSFC